MLNDWDFFSHFGQLEPFVSIPHFLQCASIPATSRGLVFATLTIRTITSKTPIAIPMYASTMNTISCYTLILFHIINLVK